MRIFVAGGTGVLGRRILPALVKAGHAVTVMTPDPARARSLVADGVDLVQGDVLDASQVGAALAAQPSRRGDPPAHRPGQRRPAGERPPTHRRHPQPRGGKPGCRSGDARSPEHRVGLRARRRPVRRADSARRRLPVGRPTRHGASHRDAREAGGAGAARGGPSLRHALRPGHLLPARRHDGGPRSCRPPVRDTGRRQLRARRRRGACCGGRLGLARRPGQRRQ